MDAGAETSASFLQGFVLALLSYPEFQQRIQTEIDTVVGSSRMPNLVDYEKLPYLQAFINEVCVFDNLQPFTIWKQIFQIGPSFQTSHASLFATYGDRRYHCALAGLVLEKEVALILHYSTRTALSQKALCSL